MIISLAFTWIAMDRYSEYEMVRGQYGDVCVLLYDWWRSYTCYYSNWLCWPCMMRLPQTYGFCILDLHSIRFCESPNAVIMWRVSVITALFLNTHRFIHLFRLLSIDPMLNLENPASQLQMASTRRLRRSFTGTTSGERHQRPHYVPFEDAK